MKIHHGEITIETSGHFVLHDITNRVRQFISSKAVNNGLITIYSRHTTTAITINENESRLLRDVETFFTELVPKDKAYLHNDIDQRDCPPDEPQNAHSHVIAMLLGTSESVPIVDGSLAIGQWQSIFLVELDGPRTRSVKFQIIGD